MLSAAELLDVDAAVSEPLVDATASVEELEVDAAALLDVDAAELLDDSDLLADVLVDPDPHPASRVATIAALIKVATTLRFMFFLL